MGEKRSSVRTFDDPLLARDCERRELQAVFRLLGASGQIERVEMSEKRALQIIDRVAASVVCFIAGLAVMYIVIRAM